MQLIFTKHAKDQMLVRGVDEDQIINAMQRGAKVKQTDGLVAVYSYVKVAYKISGESYIIKTVMVE